MYKIANKESLDEIIKSVDVARKLLPSSKKILPYSKFLGTRITNK